MQVLLLAGKAGVGKDTAATILESLYGAVPLAQADKLKELAQLVFQFSKTQLYGPSECRNASDPRFADTYSPEWEFAERMCGTVGRTWVAELIDFAPNKISIEQAHAAFCAWFYSLLDRVGWEKQLSPRTVLQTLGTEFGRVILGEDVWSQYAMSAAAGLLANGAPLVVITDGRFPNEVRRVRAEGGKALQLLERAPLTLVGGVEGHSSETALDGFDEFDAKVVNQKRSKPGFALELVRAVLPLFPGLKQVKPIMIG